MLPQFLVSLARNLFRKRGVERDLDEEVRSYVELLADEKIAAGMSPAQARRQALIEFGGLEHVKEQVRDVHFGKVLEDFVQDLRYALRALASNKAFTAIAALSLALGIGVNAAMFSVVNGALIRPLPYPRPDRLVRITDYYPKGALVALQQHSATMNLAGFTTDTEFNLSAPGEPLHLTGCLVSANLFEVLGVNAQMGRIFEPGEDQHGRDRIVVLSHTLWQDQFESAPDIAARRVIINGLERRVVGVMPAGFAFPSSKVQLWIPLDLDPSNEDAYWGAGYMPVVARLRPGITAQQAQSELRRLIAEIIPMFPFVMARQWNSDAEVIPLSRDMTGEIRGRLPVLVWAVGAVLLIACGNVASLLLARAAARRKEMALRASLGAVRARILRQLLTESIVLALGGGVLGIALAYGAVFLLKAALPAGTPRLAEVAIDGWVVLFTAGLAILTGVLFGLAPAISGSRPVIAELSTPGKPGPGGCRGNACSQLAHRRRGRVGLHAGVQRGAPDQEPVAADADQSRLPSGTGSCRHRFSKPFSMSGAFGVHSVLRRSAAPVSRDHWCFRCGSGRYPARYA